MTDLETLSDEALNEVYSGEIHGLSILVVRPSERELIERLAKHHVRATHTPNGGWQISIVGGFHEMEVYGVSDAPGLTFAKAATIALIRAGRRLETLAAKTT